MTAESFSWRKPLPPAGTTTVLEASAGTGKTFTIAGLVARFVADGVPIEQVLAVTFSRRATAELRDSTRERLVNSRTALRRALRGVPAETDPVNEVLASGPPEVIAERLARLDLALGQVDAAPILTLHTFAKRMLDELGLLADHDRTSELGSDLDVLADEVIADVFLADEGWQRLGWGYAQLLGRAAVEHPFGRLFPPDERSALRVGFATQVRAVFEQRKRLRRVLDFDDMIGRLANTLGDPATGQDAAQVLSGQFRAVLVDEFQDTDPQQWAFLAAGFHGRSTLMLIGDPKQAIYRFRGGDIETYSAARATAHQVQRLDTNHRSDKRVVEGIEMLFGPVDLGTPLASIRMTRVQASNAEPRIRFSGQELTEAVRIRAINAACPTIDAARELIRVDLLDQVNLLLDGHHELNLRPGGWRKVGPGDIAVLVSSNKAGLEIHTMLTAAGHSSVFSGEASVFTTDAARDWLTLLEALETPDSWHLRRAMLTSLVGWTSADVAAADGDELVTMTALLTRCARLLAGQGVAAVFETLVAERQLYSRLLGQPGGEAQVSDLRHVAEVLNHAQGGQQVTPSALTEHLRRRIERAQQNSDERTRRLPTDRPAIKVLTVHQAKGLQFPIVLLPQAADRYVGDPEKDAPLIGHHDGVRVVDVSTPGDRAERAEAYLGEEAAESLRSFYVACTRAQSLLVMWWSPTKQHTAASPLHRLLLNTRGEWAVPDASRPVGPASGLPRRRHVDLALVDPDPSGRQPGGRVHDQATQRLLDVRNFHDHIDRAWSRTSYTGLTAAVHGAIPGGFDLESDEQETTGDRDGAPLAAGEIDLRGDAAQLVSALAPLPGGTQFGNLVHAVLEKVDPAAADLSAAFGAAVAGLVDRFPLSGTDAEALVAGLGQTVTTPLGVLTDDLTLRDLGAHNRLAELDFELPLGSPRRGRTVADLAALFDVMLPPDDPLQRYGGLLAESAAAPTILKGFLTGSIDVVLRVPGDNPRFVVLDYKTNRVPTKPDEPLTAWHYSPTVLATAMCEAHYPLQALLYCVALHRYLGWRLPGYRPKTHLGGVGYLFVRGMVGAHPPRSEGIPHGVFTWLPPAEMVQRASELLAGGD